LGEISLFQSTLRHSEFCPFQSVARVCDFSVIGWQVATRIYLQSHQLSSTAICFRVGSSLVIRKLRICPVASGSDWDWPVVIFELPFQRALNIDVS
jgi:hypothetical protein